LKIIFIYEMDEKYATTAEKYFISANKTDIIAEKTRLLRLSYEEGYRRAGLPLAQILHNGAKKTQIHEAIKILKDVVTDEENRAYKLYALGLCYGRIEDREKMKNYFTLASREGCNFASVELLYLAEIEDNKDMAAVYFKKISNDPNMLYEIANRYEKNFIYPKAEHYYHLASRAGHLEATSKLMVGYHKAGNHELARQMVMRCAHIVYKL